MERSFLPREESGRTNRDGDVARFHLRVPLPCCLVRELARADCRVVILADCRSRGLSRRVGIRFGERRVLPDRFGNADRTGSQERHFDRGIRQGRSG